MKKIICLMLVLIMSLSMTGCNMQVVDVTYSYNYAYISLPNGECVEGEVDSWRDYEDGDQLQVVIDGTVYLTDTTRCVLVQN